MDVVIDLTEVLASTAPGTGREDSLTCFLNNESTLVCLCSNGNPRNLLRVFCLSAGKVCFFALMLLRAALKEVVDRDEELPLLLMRALALNRHTALLREYCCAMLLIEFVVAVVDLAILRAGASLTRKRRLIGR